MRILLCIFLSSCLLRRECQNDEVYKQSDSDIIGKCEKINKHKK